MKGKMQLLFESHSFYKNTIPLYATVRHLHSRIIYKLFVYTATVGKSYRKRLIESRRDKYG